MTDTQQGPGGSAQGEASEPVGGVERRLSDLSTEELLALPPFPIRHPDFANRFPVSMEEYQALELAAREPAQTALAPGEPEVQEDTEAPEQGPEGNLPEDGDWARTARRSRPRRSPTSRASRRRRSAHPTARWRWARTT